jgi:hypothetical protein
MTLDSPEVFYPQEDTDHEPTQTGTPLEIYHAPFSLLHLESQKSEGAREINFSNNGTYYIPHTSEIKKDILESEIQKNISLLPHDIASRVRNMYLTIPKDKQLYGEYLPQSYKKTSNDLNGAEDFEGKSIDPIKYVTNLLLERYLKNTDKKQEFVFHPDILYFASQGRKENLPKVLSYFNQLAGTLQQKLFIENISFTNKNFKEALGLFEDPREIYEIIKDYSNFGLVVDLHHLEKSKGDISLYDIPKIAGERMIIHSRKGFKDKYNDIYSYSVKNAIPWVIEE